MFIFIDESGSTDERTQQKFLVVSLVLTENKKYPEELIFRIKDKCRAKGKPVLKKELKYHNLTPFQREIAVGEINLEYKNFYIGYFDVDSADSELKTGKFEQNIQMHTIESVLSKLDKANLTRKSEIKIVMDKKLADNHQKAIEDTFQKYIGTKKGISVRCASSTKERGIQLADLIAGAFRAKLLKKSDLFEVDYTHIFQITWADIKQLEVKQ